VRGFLTTAARGGDEHRRSAMHRIPFSSHAQPLTAGRRRLSLLGDLDYATAPFARQAVAAAQTDTRELVIDVSGVDKADVFGLAVLLKAWHTGPADGCGIRIVKASTAVRRAWSAARMLEPLGRLSAPSHARAA
jgi:anti-anti-sigma factor